MEHQFVDVGRPCGFCEVKCDCRFVMTGRRGNYAMKKRNQGVSGVGNGGGEGRVKVIFKGY